MATELTLYEDNAGGLYWHAEGSSKAIVMQGEVLEGTALEDAACWDDWANEFWVETIFASEIQEQNLREIAIFRNGQLVEGYDSPGINGELYLRNCL